MNERPRALQLAERRRLLKAEAIAFAAEIPSVLLAAIQKFGLVCYLGSETHVGLATPMEFFFWRCLLCGVFAKNYRRGNGGLICPSCQGAHNPAPLPLIHRLITKPRLDLWVMRRGLRRELSLRGKPR